MEEKLNEPDCYINNIDGSLFIIWWASNRPPEDKEWIKISFAAYCNLYKAIFKVDFLQEGE